MRTWLVLALLAGCNGSGEPCAPNPYLARVYANGLEMWEGREAVIVAESENGACVADTSTRVTDGAFEVVLENHYHLEVYPDFAIYIDVDGNGQCSDADVGGVWIATLTSSILLTNAQIDTAFPAPCDRF